MSISDDKLLAEQGYFIIGDIGEGAYSKVRLYWSKTLKRTVAIKIINRQQAPRDFVKNFLPREIDILQKVKHPHIANIYEILATSDGRIFIVLEYSVYNDVLRHIQTNGAFDENRAKHVFGQLIEAVAYLHENKIVHRDLKCENLLLTTTLEDMHMVNPTIDLSKFKDGGSGSSVSRGPNAIKPLPLSSTFLPENVKLLLTDFGFSKIIKEREEKSRSFCGSAAYAAPEIIQGIPYTPNCHDTWSLGVVLFIMVCGTMPYDDSNVRQMVKEQLAHKIRFPPQAAYHLSSQCKDLISKLIEPNPEKRLTIQGIINHPWMDTNRKSFRPQVSSKKASSSRAATQASNESNTASNSSNAKDRPNTGNSSDVEGRAKVKKNSNQTSELWF